MKALRLATYGIRGFVGSSLTPHVVMDLAGAFGTYLEGGTVLLGRDTRYSSPMLRSATLASLLGAGCRVLDFGVCPTPILQHAVPRRGANGALSITGGHNEAGWNALSLIDAQGAPLEPLGGERVLELFHAGDIERRDWQHLGQTEAVTDFFPPYLDDLEAQLNLSAIRKARFTVLADPVGGAGCAFLAPYAARLGIRLVAMNGQPSGYLAREPEPRPRSAQQMASIIGALGGAAGFLFSSDMQRMSVVTETGEPASEEYTLALIANHLLRKRPGTLVINDCTSRMAEDIAARHHCPVVRTRVGQAYIGATLIDEDAVMGGEGSGSVMLPTFSRAFDGFLMMALVLEAMAETGRNLSELIADIPRYHIVKRSRECESARAYQAMDAVKAWSQLQKQASAQTLDGVRVDWEDGWVYARPAHTEQLVRVISESNSRSRALKRAEEVLRVVDQVL